jgi:hypothetical protein
MDHNTTADTETMTSRCYNGERVVTAPAPGCDTPMRIASRHLWAVRAYLYMTGQNRLPAITEWWKVGL